MLNSLPIRLFVSLWIWSAILVAFLLTTVAQVLQWIFLWPLFLISRAHRMQITGSTLRFFCAAAGFFLNPFWRLQIVRPPPKGYQPSKTIIMVNHLSAVDPWLTASAIFPWEMKWVYKGDLRKVPFAGWSLLSTGDLPVFFTKEKGGWGTQKDAITAMFRQVKENMELGIGCVVFPEGTRSRKGRLQPFKPGFFKFAVDNPGVEILPCVLHNSPSLWPLNSKLFNPGTAYFAFGDPIVVQPGETVENLQAQVNKFMLELFNECPLYDAETEQPLTELAPSRGSRLT
ncbi:MAG: hypothetical protein KVP17_000316 [Porospora cf. gigantea B]|uniref:uncharacterized protein n=1 Tax=Porospora cf. gigantea B TaxID=2853592 RepID=UPI003571EA74|nr:MAG: hypothetical protein KVP17_000316 [Porospora cf. gigantea B]